MRSAGVALTEVAMPLVSDARLAAGPGPIGALSGAVVAGTLTASVDGMMAGFGARQRGGAEPGFAATLLLVATGGVTRGCRCGWVGAPVGWVLGVFFMRRILLIYSA